MAMKIKQTGLPPVGNHWSYGKDHMRKVSKRTASMLCGQFGLPQMGYGLDVAIVKDEVWAATMRLEVQNISGDFYLASSTTPVDKWPAVFGYEIVE